MKIKFTWFAVVMVMATTTFALNTDNVKKTQPTPAEELISKRIFSKRSDQLKTTNQQKVLNYWEGLYDVRHNARRVLKHEWDYTRDDWFLANRENFVYDSFGRPIEIITEFNMDGIFIRNTKVNYSWHEKNGEITEIMISFWNTEIERWIPEQKEVYDYDKYGNLIRETHSQRSEARNGWTPYFKFHVDIVYTDSGKPISMEAFYWSLFAGDQWHPSYKIEYEYYKNGNVFAETFSIPSGKTFEYSYREEYYYQEHLEFSLVYVYQYFNNDWNLEYKVTDIEWYNFDLGQLKSCVFWFPDWDDRDKAKNVTWHKQFRISYEYHPKLQFETVYLEEFYFDWEETWHPVYRERTVYNDYLFKTSFYAEYYWDEWVLEYAVVSDGEFNSKGQPVDIQISAYDSWNGDLWENISRMIFEYGSSSITPGNNAPVTELAIVFPNPALNQINIAQQNMDSDMQVRIFSISGQLLHSQLIEAFSGQTGIDISGMPSGMYLMDITAGNEKQVIKFMKR